MEVELSFIKEHSHNDINSFDNFILSMRLHNLII